MSSSLQAEFLSVLIGIMRKIDIITVLTSLTINVNELKLLLHYLKTEYRIWKKKHAVKLLNIFKSLPYRHEPDEFFNFPGRNRSEKPYLYWFCTSKGHGYTAYFVGNCLVISYSKLKEKTFQHCIQFEFKPREWYMITFAHEYQRWGKISIHCYIYGQIVLNAYFPWSIESGDLFDKCFIGCIPDRHDLTSFPCQLSTFYLFSIYLEPLFVQGLYKLGPAYKNQFKFENESAHILSDLQRKAMYDGKLMNSIVFNYNPIACEEQLVLQAAPKTNISYFIHTAHAQMLSNVRSVITYSIYSTLHSVGDENRPTREQIIEMRRYMLLHLKQLVISSSGSQEEELQAILNYLHTVHEDDNLIDVLDMAVNLMSEHPRTMVPAFDRRQGLRTVFKLLASSSEITRLQALKLLGFFLQRSTILVEKVSGLAVEKRKTKKKDRIKLKFMSIILTMIKVIATLLRNAADNIHLYDIKLRFLDDLILLASASRENRRQLNK
ncbi:unnamed protein product [Rotaria sp. Silwood1]|nr:unnamed protein product [Rotaria sp. Silwood1]